MTSSTAARRFISRRIGRVTRRTPDRVRGRLWPVIPHPELLLVVVAAIALVEMDAAGLDPGQFFKIGDDRPQRVAVDGRAAPWAGWPPAGLDSVNSGCVYPGEDPAVPHSLSPILLNGLADRFPFGGELAHRFGRTGGGRCPKLGRAAYLIGG
jgi:hypothetical protein